MPSFSWSSRFREGQWRAFRKFMLEERRDVPSRVAVIQAELERIGEIDILWVKDADGVVTERRRGFRVSPEGSSLEKLIQAYTALGGNPLDISAFVGPNSSMGDGEGGVTETVPNGGILTGLPIQYAFDRGAKAGDVNFLKYRGSRFGNSSSAQSPVIWSNIQRGRKWIKQEMRWKRTRVEEMIIKLCDLREQLEEELSDLAWATYGNAPQQDYSEENYNFSLSAGYIAYFVDSVFRVPEEDNTVTVDLEAEAGSPGSPNTEHLATYPTMLSDLDEEKDSAL